MVAPRALLQELHGFDEEYFFYVEDVDLCQRVALAGKQVYLLPQARMVHYLGPSRRSTGSFAEFQRLRSFYRYFRKTYAHLPVGLFLFLFACYLALIEGGSVLGIREWEYPMGIRRRPRAKDQRSRIKDRCDLSADYADFADSGTGRKSAESTESVDKSVDRNPESGVLGLSDRRSPTDED
jgi:GT2 family glycosyltransferase